MGRKGRSMEKFVKLFEELDSTMSISEKVRLMHDYFIHITPQDGAWALFFLSGHRLKRFINISLLRKWCMEETGYEDWLFKECYATVGDTAETISLLLSSKNVDAKGISLSLSEWMLGVFSLKELNHEEQKEKISRWWKTSSRLQCFIINKILTGNLRVGVSELLTVRALEQAFRIPQAKLLYRLQGEWEPKANFFKQLTTFENEALYDSWTPYPFCLAYPLDKSLHELGNIDEWFLEWKWDGIRAQLLFRNKNLQIWSRRNELLTKQFPELMLDAGYFPENCVLDGEILAYSQKSPLSFSDLQKRMGRKHVTAQVQKRYPIAFMAYDILEWRGKDVRSLSLSERRKLLENLFHSFPKTVPFFISEKIISNSWDELLKKREEARSRHTEGLMIKKLDSPYGVGRKKGYWWKFKVNPFSIDAILIYAQPGSGIRANLYTDYTFGVWDGDVLTPIAKAYSGLNKEEIAKLDKWIRQNTIEKFGPVRQVNPQQVFEIAFEGIQISNRHKSGVALRFPRIARWRTDKNPTEADNLDEVKKLLTKPQA